jgi:Na+/melibiose symporter-like transporter
MNIYWFGLAFMWNALHPIVLPALLLRFVPEALKNTYLGAMTFVGLMLAMMIQPLAGAWSDRTRSRWGRRRPWMVAGTLASLGCLAIMAGAREMGVLALGYVLLQLFSNMAHGPAQGLIPDLIPPARHGLASGIKNLFDMGGLVVTSLVAGQLMASDAPGIAFAIIAVVLTVSATTTILATREAVGGIPHIAPGKAISLLSDLRRYPAYAEMLVARFLILLGIYVVQSFAQYYIRDWLGMANAAAVTGNLMAAIGLALTLLVFPAGWLSDRIGRWSLNIVAGVVAAIGIGLLVFARSVEAVYAFGAIIGMATGVFVSVNWALATDLVPATEGGKYLGFTNLATAGAGALSRLGGPLIDGVNALRPGAFLGYPVAFGLAALATLAGALLLRHVRHRAERNGTIS